MPRSSAFSASWFATGLVFQNIPPSLSTAIVMFSGLVCVGKLVAFGSSTGTCWMMTRIVMMKMIRSTNITSTRGVTLMSDIASPSLSAPTFNAMDLNSLAGGGGGRLDRRRRGRCPIDSQTHLRTGDQIGMQLVREVADSLLHTLIATQQDVVAQHRRHGNRQADGRHDQGFADGSCHLVDGGLASHADGDQRVINTDDGTEQTDERRG